MIINEMYGLKYFVYLKKETLYYKLTSDFGSIRKRVSGIVDGKFRLKLGYISITLKVNCYSIEIEYIMYLSKLRS